MEENKPDIEQAIKDVAKKVPSIAMQHVIITLADGRRGVFMGPQLITETEMKLGVVPRLVSVDFDPPKVFTSDKPVVEETPDADKKIDESPAAGLE